MIFTSNTTSTTGKFIQHKEEIVQQKQNTNNVSVTITTDLLLTEKDNKGSTKEKESSTSRTKLGRIQNGIISDKRSNLMIDGTYYISDVPTQSSINVASLYIERVLVLSLFNKSFLEQDKTDFNFFFVFDESRQMAI